jgi:hypothetical protein
VAKNRMKPSFRAKADRGLREKLETKQYGGMYVL